MATIFTKIIRGEIPCYKIAENSRFFSFLDIRPASKGHTLVIPKAETDYLFDLDDKDLADMVVFAKSVAKAMDKALSPIRTGVIVEGMEVPHAHIHLIPIYSEGQKLVLGGHVELSQDEMAEIAARIRKEWEAGA
ncbi:HIT family protein [Balneolaceae bacterium ANBcel3]|nr:HIT family protein [Balneolaceae bacterium ANBcel3]